MVGSVKPMARNGAGGIPLTDSLVNPYCVLGSVMARAEGPAV
jgi:hypothetical protein